MKGRPGWVMRLWVACRPWSAPISTIPVLLGVAGAVVVAGAPMRWGRLVLTLLGSWFAHASANLWSDLADFRRGLDRVALPVSGALVRGWLNEQQTFAMAVTTLLLAGVCGLALAALAGPVPLWIAAAGFPLALAYPWLKRIAAGDAAVFAAFGPLISAGAWSVMTGRFSWVPVLWAAPFGLLVIAVLHANNWRDEENDRSLGVLTVAGALGPEGSRRYFGVLVFGAFVLTAALIVVPRWVPALRTAAMPWTAGLVFAALPKALVLWRHARAAPRPTTLDGETAAFMLPFGVMNVVGLLLAAWF
ncbi:MAG: prenyltransferase [Kiritimatiellae bacterium]|nr:prenyltransferase [Kiritimatiellia bacterium]